MDKGHIACVQVYRDGGSWAKSQFIPFLAAQGHTLWQGCLWSTVKGGKGLGRTGHGGCPRKRAAHIRSTHFLAMQGRMPSLEVSWPWWLFQEGRCSYSLHLASCCSSRLQRGWRSSRVSPSPAPGWPRCHPAPPLSQVLLFPKIATIGKAKEQPLSQVHFYPQGCYNQKGRGTTSQPGAIFFEPATIGKAEIQGFCQVPI